MRKILRILGRIRAFFSWVNLPFDIHTILSYARKLIWPLVLAVLTGAIGFFREAPFPQVVVTVLLVFVVAYLFVWAIHHLTPFLKDYLQKKGLTDSHDSGSKTGSTSELDIQGRWREQDGLDAYFVKMRQWLDNSDAPLDVLPPEHPHHKSAQEDTMRILSRLSPGGKREVVSFLHGRELIKAGAPIISLVRADLSGANLSELGLAEAAMSYANLREADLSDAVLSWLGATGADKKKGLKRLDEKFSVLDSSSIVSMDLSQPIKVSHLIHTDISGAVLKRTRLAGCILHYADFADTDLDEADLRGADLRAAYNLTQQQIDSAYGSLDQEGGAPDTQLPDDLEAPLKWKLPLKQQQEVRRRKS